MQWTKDKPIKSEKQMIKSVRIKKEEQLIIKYWLENNRPRMIEPMTASELIHVLISIGLQKLEVTDKGDLKFK